MSESAYRCEHQATPGVACDATAAWVILVGAEDQHVSCDEHRNDVLIRFETKDVSGIYRLSALDDGASGS